MSEETKKTSEEQEAEKEIPVTDGDQEEKNLTPEGEDLPEEENNTCLLYTSPSPRDTR